MDLIELDGIETLSSICDRERYGLTSDAQKRRVAKHDSGVADMLAAGFDLDDEPDDGFDGHHQEWLERVIPDDTAAIEQTQRLQVPTSPEEFGDLWPSSRKLHIHHDDTTFDGNYNLRLETPVELQDGAQLPLTLFHLKMNNLDQRRMSLRRYSRSSGREVCNTAWSQRKSRLSTKSKPTTKRTLSSAVASLKSSKSSKERTQMQEDSDGIGDSDSTEENERDEAWDCNDEILLEFSNYAHVKLGRCLKARKSRYEFEYWGHKLCWTATDTSVGAVKGRAFQLSRTGFDEALASIVPQPRTAREMVLEETKGGWIAPSLMWIDEEKLLSKADIAEVVVATGIIALVDDTVRTKLSRCQTQRSVRPLSRSSSLKADTNSVGPRKFFDEVLRHARPRLKSRRNTSST